MNETMILVLAVLAGLLLGAFFFGGLWWTVKRSLASPHPALWILASFLSRTAIAVGGFYLALQGGWQGLVACMGGFLVARLLVTRLIGAQSRRTVKPVRRIPS